VQVAPDGSLIVADWYDPGVGGHAAGDLERGRLFRVTPSGHKGYKPPKYDFSAAAGAVEALKSPNYATRYVAWQALHGMGDDARAALTAMAEDANPRFRARALWLLGKTASEPKQAINAFMECVTDQDPDLWPTGMRMARQTLDSGYQLGIVRSALSRHVGDPRWARELSILIRDLTHQRDLTPDDAERLAGAWATLASWYDGNDRWLLEALGIAADRQWDACFAAWLEKVGGPDKAIATKAGRDIVWRARTKAALPLLVKILTNPQTPQAERERYVRALDFHPKSPEKDEALQAILGL
jgi:hypothetical protein